ncbi:MAG: hypothetical protein DRI86_01005 [Bacteroidetes bacterium]|nr:MAG: hypothetical protein DRI86_01005 [Bacteroidota bacterium]
MKKKYLILIIFIISFSFIYGQTTAVDYLKEKLPEIKDSTLIFVIKENVCTHCFSQAAPLFLEYQKKGYKMLFVTNSKSKDNFIYNIGRKIGISSFLKKHKELIILSQDICNSFENSEMPLFVIYEKNSLLIQDMTVPKFAAHITTRDNIFVADSISIYKGFYNIYIPNDSIVYGYNSNSNTMIKIRNINDEFSVSDFDPSSMILDTLKYFFGDTSQIQKSYRKQLNLDKIEILSCNFIDSSFSFLVRIPTLNIKQNNVNVGYKHYIVIINNSLERVKHIVFVDRFKQGDYYYAPNIFCQYGYLNEKYIYPIKKYSNNKEDYFDNNQILGQFLVKNDTLQFERFLDLELPSKQISLELYYDAFKFDVSVFSGEDVFVNLVNYPYVYSKKDSNYQLLTTSFIKQNYPVFTNDTLRVELRNDFIKFNNKYFYQIKENYVSIESFYKNTISTQYDYYFDKNEIIFGSYIEDSTINVIVWNDVFKVYSFELDISVKNTVKCELK